MEPVVLGIIPKLNIYAESPHDLKTLFILIKQIAYTIVKSNICILVPQI